MAPASLQGRIHLGIQMQGCLILTLRSSHYIAMLFNYRKPSESSRGPPLATERERPHLHVSSLFWVITTSVVFLSKAYSVWVNISITFSSKFSRYSIRHTVPWIAWSIDVLWRDLQQCMAIFQRRWIMVLRCNAKPAFVGFRNSTVILCYLESI